MQSNTTGLSKIAPGTGVYFDMEIDPTGTEVAVRYDITLDLEGKLSDNLVFSSAEETNQKQKLIKTGKNTYTGIISLSDIEKQVKANTRLYVTWENHEENNEQDSLEGSIFNNTTNFPVKVVVSQYMGEEITEFE